VTAGALRGVPLEVQSARFAAYAVPAHHLGAVESEVDGAAGTPVEADHVAEALAVIEVAEAILHDYFRCPARNAVVLAALLERAAQEGLAQAEWHC
jgi:hypothetical protein